MDSLIDLTVKSICALSRQKSILMAFASIDFSPLPAMEAVEEKELMGN